MPRGSPSVVRASPHRGLVFEAWHWGTSNALRRTKFGAHIWLTSFSHGSGLAAQDAPDDHGEYGDGYQDVRRPFAHPGGLTEPVFALGVWPLALEDEEPDNPHRSDAL